MKKKEKSRTATFIDSPSLKTYPDIGTAHLLVSFALNNWAYKTKTEPQNMSATSPPPTLPQTPALPASAPRMPHQPELIRHSASLDGLNVFRRLKSFGGAYKPSDPANALLLSAGITRLHPLTELIERDRFARIQQSWSEFTQDWNGTANPIFPTVEQRTGMLHYMATAKRMSNEDRLHRLRFFLDMANMDMLADETKRLERPHCRIELDQAYGIFGDHHGDSEYVVAKEILIQCQGLLCSVDGAFALHGKKNSLRDYITHGWLDIFYWPDGVKFTERDGLMSQVAQAFFEYFGSVSVDGANNIVVSNLPQHKTAMKDDKSKRLEHHREVIEAFALEMCKTVFSGPKYVNSSGQEDEADDSICPRTIQAFARAKPLCVYILHALGKLDLLTTVECFQRSRDVDGWEDVLSTLQNIAGIESWREHCRQGLRGWYQPNLAQAATVGVRAAGILNTLLAVRSTQLKSPVF